MSSRINSRTKGSKNERNLTKLFAEWTGKEFARTPSSGGLGWRNSQTVGDIVCTTEGHLFPFAIEAKSHREINFEHLLYLEEPKILEFWEQAKNDSVKGKVKKVPLLFMRYNGMPKNFHFVGMTTQIWSLFSNYFPANHRRIVFHSGLLHLTIIRSTTLFKSDYKQVRNALKKSDQWPQ